MKADSSWNDAIFPSNMWSLGLIPLKHFGLKLQYLSKNAQNWALGRVSGVFTKIILMESVWNVQIYTQPSTPHMRGMG